MKDHEQDFLAWLIPQHQHPLATLFDRVFLGYASTKVRYRYSAFLGYVAVGLVGVGLVKRRKKRRVWFWLGLAVLCFIMALGPNLWFDGNNYTDIPLPYKLVEWLSPVQMLGTPRRFSALLGLPVAVLAGYGALALKEWLPRWRKGRWLAHPAVLVTLLSLMILVDYLSIPTLTVSAQVPAFYTALADEPDDFAFAILPGRRRYTEYYMFYQTIHGRPILGGHVSRLPPEALEFMSSIPLLKGTYEDGEIDTSLPDVSFQLSRLSEAGFRYLVIHKTFATGRQLNAWRSYFLMIPRYEDDEVVVYTTTPIVGKDFPV
ncbi:MAG: hypothetical protein KAT70_08580, partial [Thermoplasmata archaeon]|nr:hypothetical protein [Thermoplasmata archaeon]